MIIEIPEHKPKSCSESSPEFEESADITEQNESLNEVDQLSDYVLEEVGCLAEEVQEIVGRRPEYEELVREK